MPSKRALRQPDTSPRSPSRTPEHAALLHGLGREIRALRVERGHTQQGFAAQAGLAWRYYGAIERGEHSVTFVMLAKIAAGARSARR